ncbi:MAG: MFS transporter [Oscillospiraceae bacterium]|nr:MFS transporter [Oscillospiraceae bacterium]
MKLQDKKQITKLTFLFMMTYMVSYITRINYGAVIAEMETETGFPRTLLSMALTGSFITYGSGQIISGILGDRFSPKKLIALGFLLTISMNLLIPICTSPYQMLAVWCVNGFAQALMWPPLVRLLTYHLTPEDYKRSVTKVSWGVSFGTIAVYLIAPILITLFHWKAMFLFSAGCGILMLLVWLKTCPDVERVEPTPAVKTEQVVPKSRLLTPLLFAVLLAAMLQGLLRDGATTWMPTYIADTYRIGNAAAILTGVILPLFSLLCYHITLRLYTTRLKNPITCTSIIFLFGTISAFGLFLFTGKNAFLSVLFSAFMTGAMHGTNMMITTMLPPFFQNRGNISTVSGVINSSVYVGSALSTYGVALISELFGWSVTMFTWFVVALVGTAICFAIAKPWEKQMKE